MTDNSIHPFSSGRPPVVTVGIPVYNAERFIHKAIRSVLNQTFVDFEVIITDDGSTDHTLQMLNSFSDPRITIVRNSANRGLSYNLNLQVSMAHGKYFCRMDADDIMMPYRLQRQVDFLENNPDVDMVSGNAVVIDDDDNIIGMRAVNDIYEHTKMNYIRRRANHIHPTVCGRMSFFRDYPYHSDMDSAEDLDLWIRAAGKKKMRKVSEAVLFYRDPLKFKVSTYMRRMKQLRNEYRSLYKSGDIGLPEYLKLVHGTYLRQAAAAVTKFMPIDHMIISRRNSSIDRADISCYEDLLVSSVRETDNL